MNSKVILLAEQIISGLPKNDVEELVEVLRYVNRFKEEDRPRLFKESSDTRIQEEMILEENIKKSFSAERYSNRSYTTSNTAVCRLCGK